MGNIMASKSIVQDSKECWVCGTTLSLQRHHVFYGNANRRLSEKYGCWVWLCGRHHTGNVGVHFSPDMDSKLKKYTQECFENQCGTREDFRAIFGKSYLDMI